MHKRLLSSLLTLLCVSGLQAQNLGGKRVLNFLTLPVSARATAMGGSLITIQDDDLSLALGNPAILNKGMDKQISAGLVAYPGGIHFGNFQYAQYHEKWNTTFHGGIHYLTYGEFQGTNAVGTEQGQFSAGEFELYSGASYPYLDYRFGGNIKLIYSKLESYNSLSIAMDAAASYTDTAKQFTASLVISNIGAELKSYTKESRSSLPFDIQVGFSKRFQHMPFRLSVTLHKLYQWDLRGSDANSNVETDLLGEPIDETGGASIFFDNMMRHFIIGGEFYIAKVLHVNMAYNHLRRQEMALTDKGGFTGFSMGFGVRIKAFSIDYGFGKYHLAGAAHHFTIQARMAQLLKKKQS